MADYRPAHLPGRDYDLYCAESLEAHGQDRYGVVSILSCPRGLDAAVVQTLMAARSSRDDTDAIGWPDPDEMPRPFHGDLVAVFLRHPELQVRAVAVEHAAIARYWADTTVTDDETLPGSYNVYYQLLAHWVGAASRYCLYWSPGVSRDPAWFDALTHLLITKLAGRAQIYGAGTVEPQYRDLVSLSAFVAGAVGHVWNRSTNGAPDGSPREPSGALAATDGLANALAHALERESLGAANRPGDVRFKAYTFQLPEPQG